MLLDRVLFFLRNSGHLTLGYAIISTEYMEENQDYLFKVIMYWFVEYISYGFNSILSSVCTCRKDTRDGMRIIIDLTRYQTTDVPLNSRWKSKHIFNFLEAG